MSASKIETWLKAGYKVLGTDGLEGIKIERLARVLNLNKSGFYYYFGTMEVFLKGLLRYHLRIAEEVASELARCETIDPDLLLLIVRHKPFFLVESQLLVKSRVAHSGDEMDDAGKIITSQLLSLFQRDNNTSSDTTMTPAYLNIIRHFIYARIDADNITYEYLQDLAAETKKAFEKVTIDRHVSSHNTGSSTTEK